MHLILVFKVAMLPNSQEIPSQCLAGKQDPWGFTSHNTWPEWCPLELGSTALQQLQECLLEPAPK